MLLDTLDNWDLSSHVFVKRLDSQGEIERFISTCRLNTNSGLYGLYKMDLFLDLYGRYISFYVAYEPTFAYHNRCQRQQSTWRNGMVDPCGSHEASVFSSPVQL